MLFIHKFHIFIFLSKSQIEFTPQNWDSSETSITSKILSSEMKRYLEYAQSSRIPRTERQTERTNRDGDLCILCQDHPSQPRGHSLSETTMHEQQVY